MFCLYLISLQQNEVFNVNSDLGNRFQRLQGPEKIVLCVSAILLKVGSLEFMDLYF